MSLTSSLVFLSLTTLPPSRDIKIRLARSIVQTEHLLRPFLHRELTDRGKSAVEKQWVSSPSGASAARALVVFLQGRGQGRRQVDLQVVGQQQNDEEDITELISN
jgi:hypothetical protein